jgi:hypothetical protein
VEAPADIDKCLAILVLRRAGCSQDVVVSIMRCAKSRVGEVENWFKQIPYSMAVEVCSETAIKEMISLDIFTSDQLDKTILQKVERITPGIILRYYRPDHLVSLRQQETMDLAVRLQSSMFNISAKDWAIWGLPDTGKPTQTSEAGLRLGRDRGELVVKLSVEMDQSFPLFMARLKAFFQEFGYYDQWRESLTDLVCRCLDMANEIQIKAETETGLFLSTYPPIGKGHLINVPKYIYEFALDNYASEKQPVLKILKNDPKHWIVVPGGLHGYMLAKGSEDEMEKCKKVTSSLSVQYAKDERIGRIVANVQQLKEQTAPLQAALSAVIKKAAGDS